MKSVVRSMGIASEKPTGEKQAIIAAFAAWHAGETLTVEQQRLIDEAGVATLRRQFEHYFSTN
jgi:hypothetical protein